MNEQKKTGPEPERVKVVGSWEKAVKRALNKPRPAEGWPGRPVAKKKRKKKAAKKKRPSVR